MAPEPLIPLTVLQSPIVRCAIAGNALGWGAIIGLNVFLPIYLQGALRLSATEAGLSLVGFMVAMNACAALAGQVLGRVRRYKLLPMFGLLVSIAATMWLAWHAGGMTPLAFEVTVIVIGAGFGPLPSMTAAAMQNVVPRHQLGISIGTMNFTRNLYATMLIAVFGAIVLGGTGHSLSDALAADTGAAGSAFSRVFFVAAASMAVALVALAIMREKPLQTDAEMAAE
jgi:MFS family permease